MRLRLSAVTIVTLLVAPSVLTAQTADISGTWEVDTPDGPQTVVVRPDSSASFGDEIVRWRMIADTIFIAFGDEWVGYNYVLHGRTLTLSGGDLEEPYDLKRLGPPSALPTGAEVPPAPPMPPDTTREPEQ
jgi:hypothetical protein